MDDDDDDDDDHSKGQTFSHEKHYILSSELKHLYVAVTRARQRIWIYDENTEFSEPMRSYWKRYDLTVVKNTNEINLSTLAKLAKKSNPDEWNEKGRCFFDKKNYEQVKKFHLKYFIVQ